MSVNDPISDMLTRIRNAGMARKRKSTMPSTKVLVAIAKILSKRGTSRIRSRREAAARRVQDFASLWRGQAALDPRDQAGEQARSARLRRQGCDSPRQQRTRHRDREHAAGRADRVTRPGGGESAARCSAPSSKTLEPRAEERKMSRIGRQTDRDPVRGRRHDRRQQLSHGQGTKGELLSTRLRRRSDASTHEDGTISVERPDDERQHRSLHGLYRTLLNNMVVGVTDGSARIWRSRASAIAPPWTARPRAERRVIRIRCE